jgi:hypothetical protein
MEAASGDAFAHDGARVRHPESWFPHPHPLLVVSASPYFRTGTAPARARHKLNLANVPSFRAAGEDVDVLDRVQLARVRGPTDANRF